MGLVTSISSKARILVVDDEPGMQQYLRTVLEAGSYEVFTVPSGLEALARVTEDPLPDVVLLDVLMPNMDGLRTLEKLRETRPGLKVVMLSCSTDPRNVVQAIRSGATDYLTKPFQISELEAVLRHSLASHAVSSGADGEATKVEIEDIGGDQFFVAASPAMRKIRAQVDQVANFNVPVLILGESGTGKEVVARLVHKRSARADRPFMKVNCAALPADLLESELFGYEPGAFTGANRAKPGKFELCDTGTFLLDEIGELPAALQAKLLHVIQDQEFSRLGSRSTIKVDVRVLAATNVDIQEAIAAKRFREDLFYRLNTFTIQIPPLRERREEIPLLLSQFMARFALRYARAPLPLSPGLVDACVRYSWPGNLRELENFVKRYLILADESLVRTEMQEKVNGLGPAPEAPAAKDPPPTAGGLKSLVRNVKDLAEIEAISRALEETRWNRKKAARLLEISYKALLYKIRQYGIEK
ncbi:MAG: sigma-54-dependent Fis family transcriptional regulator [Acidobacteria bacterium]|nr:MAG: sigma-54-dependent Fis family transcriptional regulator [Acidobacteriota bacterium]